LKVLTLGEANTSFTVLTERSAQMTKLFGHAEYISDLNIEPQLNPRTAQLS